MAAAVAASGASPIGQLRSSPITSRPKPDDVVRRALSASHPVVALTLLGGGDVAESFRVDLADGTRIFAKTHLRPPPRFFDTEARGLEWLRAAGTPAVPRVILATEEVLALEWIDAGRAQPDEAAFGVQLADLHRAGAPSFGRADRRTTGSRQLPNEPYATWAESFAQNRLLPLVRLAHDAQALSADALWRLERLADHLDRLGVPAEPPARLHGDLWAGNRLVDTTGRSWLIDPAAHGGHREFDLAMMLLFGGFADECFASYHERSPLEDGWRDRVPLHQLAPLVVHAIKFGGGYRAASERALTLAERLG
jgi:fructosamine-3-kinase